MISINELLKLKKNGDNISLILKNNNNLSDFEKISIQYELQAGDYIEYYNNNYDYIKLVLNQYIEYFKDIFNKISNQEKIYLLDAGSGESTTITYILNNLDYYPNLTIIQYESSLSRLNLGKEFIKKNIKYNYNIEYICGNLEYIPINTNSIDIIFTNHALEPNGNNYEKILNEFNRICNKYILLFEPSYVYNSDEGRSRMNKFNYINDELIINYINSLNYDLIKSEMLKYVTNKLNPTRALCFFKNGTINKNNFELVCPKFKDKLKIYQNHYYKSVNNNNLYNTLNNIKILIYEKSTIYITND